MKSSATLVDHTNPTLEKHMRFICPECGDEFCNQQEWRQHLNEDHDYSTKTHVDFDFKEVNERYHECLICQKWVANARNAVALLQYHRFLHLPYSRTYRCRYCTGAFTRKRALCEHLHRFHSRQIARLEKQRNAEDLLVATTLKDSQENNEFYLRFVCPHCGTQLDRFEQWRHHLNTVHTITSSAMRVHRITGTQKHYCLHCKQLIVGSDKESLQRHCFSHMPHKAFFKCAYCTVKKTYKEEVLRHFLCAHPNESATAKALLTMPQQWGGRASDKIIDELDVLLCGSKSGNEMEKQTDLIQKALFNSLIDLESETTPNTKLCSKTAKEHALDQSLNDLEAILRDDLQAQQNVLCQRQAIAEGIDDRELEQLYADIFEEIEPEVKTNINASAYTTRLPKQDRKKRKPERTESEEQVISIEINAIDEHAEEEFQASKLKRLKLHHGSNIATEEAVKLLLEVHIKYLCPQCGLEFEQQIAWRQHVFNAHNLINAIQMNFKPLDSSSYLCLECMDVLNSTKHTDLQRHHFMHMPFQSYLKCTVCSITKSSKPKMLQHLRERHAQLLACKQQQVLSATSSTMLHFKCQPCGKTFQTQLYLQDHRAHCSPHPAIFTVTRLYNITENRKLLVHLREARARISEILAEDQVLQNNHRS